MRKNNLAHLKLSLSQPDRRHLTDETLAEMASREASGEDISLFYADHFQHIETCITCAEAYSELVEMMLSATAEMAGAAAEISPVQVYTKIIYDEIRATDMDRSELFETIQMMVRDLPTRLTNLPVVATDLPLEASLESSEKLGKESPLPRLVFQAMQKNLAALELYLTGAANAIWGKSLKVKSRIVETWQSLQFNLATQPAITTLEGNEIGNHWTLISLPIKSTIPLKIKIQAKRISSFACELSVQIDRPGLQDASGRVVQVEYQQHILLAETNSMGIACLGPIPIGAIPTLEVRIAS